jgi:single-strand DNA-binding protein
MNTVVLVGNISQGPELEYTSQGTPRVRFSVAVSRRIRVDGEWKDQLDGFFTCVAWKQLAEHAAKALQKGMRVLVAGRLQQRTWETEDGSKRSVIEVVVDEVGPGLRFTAGATAEPNAS